MGLIVTSRKSFDAAVSRQATEACDQIMNEMGAEIHDDLIQKLSIFRLYMDRLETSGYITKEMEQLFTGMKTDFENVSQSVRRISRRMMPVRMENDSFIVSVEMLCQNMESTKSGNIHFEHSGVEQNMPVVMQTHLYRIIQELIHNAFKHSSAWHIWVRLKWETSKVTVEVEDDGTGVHHIPKFIERLRKKYNTLRMRTRLLGASITYLQGSKGLLAKVEIPIA
ncbi:MAG TPA: ATP-binding protein [Chryseolinea sp.]|nr:ATP-binding protein [Chryseolinea sp.]